MHTAIKSTYLLAVMLLFLTACNHRFARLGYDLEKSDYRMCDIPIKKALEVDGSIAGVIGEIEIGQGKWTSNCSEVEARELLLEEACSIYADFIVITEEVYPDEYSSCYLCKAAFYAYKDAAVRPYDVSEEDDPYVPENAPKQGKNKAVIITGSIMFVVLIALLILV